MKNYKTDTTLCWQINFSVFWEEFFSLIACRNFFSIVAIETNSIIKVISFDSTSKILLYFLCDVASQKINASNFYSWRAFNMQFCATFKFLEFIQNILWYQEFGEVIFRLIELEFTSLTPTIETPEQCAKMFKCDNKDITWFRYLYFKLWTNLTLLYPGPIKLIPDNWNWPPFWNGSTLRSHI